MASIIKIKRSGVTGSPSALGNGELAYSYLSGAGGDRLYIGTGTEDESGAAANIEVIGGKYFTDMLDHTAGTTTASSAIITDANNKISVLNVDNIVIDGNTVSTTSGNLTLNPTGSLDVNNNSIINVADPTTAQGAATKAYVDAQVGSSTISLTDGSTTELIDLNDSDVVFGPETASSANGSGDVTVSLVGGEMLIGLRDTGPHSGSGSTNYGSSTAVPVISVNRKGQITAVTETTIAGALNIAGDNSTSAAVNLLTDTLTFAAGTGIASVEIDDTDDTTDTVTVTATTATATDLGVASFATADFAVSSGAVTIKTGGVSNDQLAGSIANGKLANSAISVTDGSTTSDVALGGTLTFTADEGIDITQSGGTVTIAAEDATTTNKGVASFDANHFTVTSGAVTITDGTIDADALAGTLNLTGKTVTLANETVTNDQLVNDAITINGASTALGGSVTLGTDDVAEGSTNLYYTPARADSDAKNAISIGADAAASGDGGIAYNPATGVFTYTPAEASDALSDLTAGTGVAISSDFEVSIGQDVATTANVTFNNINATGNLEVDGNLTVSGTTTTINTETLTTTDPLMHLADSNTTTDAVDIGFIGRYSDNGTDVFHTGFFRDATDGKFRIFNNVADADLVDNANTVNTAASGYQAAGLVVGTLEASGTITGDLTGDVTGTVSSLSNHNTSALAEDPSATTSSGTMYFTNARAVAAMEGALTAGEGIDISGSTISAELATETNAGIATFDGTNFTVTGGDVTSADITLAGDGGAGANATLGESFTITGGSSPISTTASGTSVTLAIADAVADGSTKGVAAFNATNFSSASGVITTDAITVTTSNSNTVDMNNGGGLTFAADTAANPAGISTHVVSGNIQIRQQVATTSQRGAAQFADSDFEMVGDIVAIKAIDGGTF